MDYVSQRGYVLKTVKEYARLLSQAGFGDVEACDVTDYFLDVSSAELARYRSIRDQVLEDFSEEDFSHIVTGWEEKIARAETGDQAWGMFTAKKLYK